MTLPRAHLRTRILRLTALTVLTALLLAMLAPPGGAVAAVAALSSPQLDPPQSGFDGTTLRVTLRWSAVAAADQYEVYRDDRLVYTGPAVATTWEDTAVSVAQTYQYQVAALAGGERSPLSGAMMAVTPPDSGHKDLATSVDSLLQIISGQPQTPNLILDSAGGFLNGIRKWVAVGIRKDNLEAYNELLLEAQSYRSNAINELLQAKTLLKEGNYEAAEAHRDQAYSFLRLQMLADTAAHEAWMGNLEKAKQVEEESGKLIGDTIKLVGKVAQVAGGPVGALGTILVAEGTAINIAIDIGFAGVGQAAANEAKGKVQEVIATYLLQKGALKLGADLGKGGAGVIYSGGKMVLDMGGLIKTYGSKVAVSDDILKAIADELARQGTLSQDDQQKVLDCLKNVDLIGILDAGSTPSADPKDQGSRPVGVLGARPTALTATGNQRPPNDWNGPVVRVLMDGLPLQVAPNDLPPVGSIVGRPPDSVPGGMVAWSHPTVLRRGDVVKCLGSKSAVFDPWALYPQSTLAYKVETIDGTTGWVVGQWGRGQRSFTLAEYFDKMADVTTETATVPEFAQVSGTWHSTFTSSGGSATAELQLIQSGPQYFYGTGRCPDGTTFSVNGAVCEDYVYLDEHFDSGTINNCGGVLSGSIVTGTYSSGLFWWGKWTLEKTSPRGNAPGGP